MMFILLTSRHLFLLDKVVSGMISHLADDTNVYTPSAYEELNDERSQGILA